MQGDWGVRTLGGGPGSPLGEMSTVPCALRFPYCKIIIFFSSVHSAVFTHRIVISVINDNDESKIRAPRAKPDPVCEFVMLELTLKRCEV